MPKSFLKIHEFSCFALVLRCGASCRGACLVSFLAVVISLEQRKTSFSLSIAMTSDFQQCGILTSVDSDLPVHHPLKRRNLK